MKRLIIDQGLLITDMELCFKGQAVLLKRVLVDTGSASTIVSCDLAQLIGIEAEDNDQIYTIHGVGGSELVYSKVVDSIKIGKMTVENYPIEIGAMDYGFTLDGILGLDLLQQMKAMININNLSLQWTN